MIFNQAGYTIESNFFNTNYFQKYYLPLKFEDSIYPRAALTPCYNFSATSLTLAAGPSAQYLNPSVGNTCNNVPFTANTTTIIFPTGYNGVIKWKFNWIQTNTTPCTIAPFPYAYFLWLNGVTFPGTIILSDNKVCSTTNVEIIVEIPIPSTGQIQFGFVGDAVSITNFTAEIVDATKLLKIGSTFNYANEFPTDEFKQIDFITSINKLFNFIVVPSPNKQNTLIVEPIIDYIGKGEIIDWTDKIDFDSPINVYPTTNILNGTLKYNFLLDQDYYNQQFNISRNRIFGTYEVQLNQDYKEQKTEFNTIFGSPTDYPIPNTESPIITAPSMYAVKTKQQNSESFLRFEPYKVIPRIIFRGNVEPYENYRPGVYWYLETNSIDRWQNLNRFNTYPFSYTGFSHYINFNAQDNYESDEYMPELQQDMYDVYYYDYVSDIVSPENKLISAKIYLTPWEISNLRFDEKIIVKNNYYRINKISNYNLSEPSLCDIELIKLTKSYTPHPVIYLRLVSCNPLMEVLYTNTDLNFNLYAYIGKYVNVYTDSGSYVDCFEVQLDEPRYDVDYYHYFIGSGYTSAGVGVYNDCSCTERSLFDIVQQSYPIPVPPEPVTPTPTPSITPTSVTPTPTPTITSTPSVTPTITPTNTQTITPTITSTQTTTPTPTVTPTASPVASFDPSDLPGVYLWFRADTNVVVNGGEVTSWTDIINSKVASSGGTKPFTYISSDADFNSQPSISFDKDSVFSCYLTAPSITFNGNDIFYWAVYYMNTPYVLEQIWTDLSFGGYEILQDNSGGSLGKNEFLPYPVQSSRFVSPYSPNLAQAQIFMGQLNNTALTYQLWDNRLTPSTGGTTTAAVASGTGNLFIGNGFSFAPYQYQMDGKIAELGYSWTIPSPSELNNLFNYLITRYNVTLS